MKNLCVRKSAGSMRKVFSCFISFFFALHAMDQQDLGGAQFTRFIKRNHPYEGLRCPQRFSALHRSGMTKELFDKERDASKDRRFFSCTHIKLKDNRTVGIEEYYQFTKYVLSLDGGGVRGAYTAAKLLTVHRSIYGGEEELPSNLTNHFDIMRYKGNCQEDNRFQLFQIFQGGISGTSTGAILALALAAPYHRENADPTGRWVSGPYSLPEIIKLYDALSKEVFANNKISRFFYGVRGTFWGPKYSHSDLREQLETYFGTMRLGESLVPVQISTYKVNPPSGPVFFDSYENPVLSMVDAALASSAAPTYFPEHKIDGDRYVDGGVCNNQPLFSSLALAFKHYQVLSSRDKIHKKVKELNHLDGYTAVSVGTGTKDIGAPKNGGGQIRWMVRKGASIIDVLSNTPNASNEALFKIFHKMGSNFDPFFRIQTTLKDTPLDDPKKIKDLVKRAHQEDIMKLTDLLKSIQKEKISYLDNTSYLYNEKKGGVPYNLDDEKAKSRDLVWIALEKSDKAMENLYSNRIKRNQLQNPFDTIVRGKGKTLASIMDNLEEQVKHNDYTNDQNKAEKVKYYKLLRKKFDFCRMDYDNTRQIDDVINANNVMKKRRRFMDFIRDYRGLIPQNDNEQHMEEYHYLQEANSSLAFVETINATFNI